jgi:cytochrome d ubiquinol oxidase subunit II
MIFDYFTLKIIWYVLIGVLLAGFAIMGGSDMGVSALLPVIGKKDDERRVLINTIGPMWEGNQVWFILAGGAIFAAWPIAYATAFSGLYYALFLVLATLIIRPPGFDYRAKINDLKWRKFWDACLFLSGVVPALVFGVGIGNLFIGLPFYFDITAMPFYTGTFWALLNPFALLVGVVSLCLLCAQGALFIQAKTQGLLQARAKNSARLFGLLFILCFILAGLWVHKLLIGYQITAIPDLNTSMSVQAKTVERLAGAWNSNYEQVPYLWAVPGVTIITVLFALLFSTLGRAKTAVFIHSGAILGCVGTAAIALFSFCDAIFSYPQP